jgi:nitrite reductase/ring-hydroxylating ferredoxin subunit
MIAMHARVPHVGTYRRELPVSLERLYENAIDWEHLPYLHSSSFSRIERIESGDWGFRARVWTHPFEERRGLVIELKLDRDCRRWITRTLAGSGTGTEIWTHAFSLAERTTLVVVDFFVPGARESAVNRLRDYYHRLYARLYDEDVAMMTVRQTELDRIRAGHPSGKAMREVIGEIAELHARLPLETEFAGMRFKIIELDGKLVAFSTRCAHLMGPLGEGRIEGGVVECPWHGYQFDIASGECLSGAACRLAQAPKVKIDSAGNVVLETNSHHPNLF